MSEIDPVQFGQMKAEIQLLKNEVDLVRSDIKELLEIANRGRGALWVAVTLGGFVGSLITFLGKYVFR